MLTRREKHRNFKRNNPALYAEWLQLPPWLPGLVVRCPTHNRDGSPIAEGNVAGCGSASVAWDGEVYDCLECGIFFSDYAADPPHRREESDQISGAPARLLELQAQGFDESTLLYGGIWLRCTGCEGLGGAAVFREDVPEHVPGCPNAPGAECYASFEHYAELGESGA